MNSFVSSIEKVLRSVGHIFDCKILLLYIVVLRTFGYLPGVVRNTWIPSVHACQDLPQSHIVSQ